MPIIAGTGSNDTIIGTAGDDIIYGLNGDDIIDGGEGNDVIYGGLGENTSRGGAGDDTFVWTRTDNLGNIDGGSGQDTIDLGAYDSSSFFFSQPLNISLRADGVVQMMAQGFQRGGPYYDIPYGTAVGIERWVIGAGVWLNLPGSSMNLTVVSTGYTTITTGSGNDVIHGSAVTEVIRAGAGNNTVDGGGGGDTLYLDYSLAASSLTVSNGVTTIVSGSATNIVSNVTHVVFTDRTVDFTAQGALVPDGNRIVGQNPGLISGSAGVDVVFASYGNYVLNGLAGDDWLFGFTGNDTLIGGAGSDYLDGGAGTDAALYSGLRLQYTASSTAVSGGPEGGTDRLTSIEEARFIDGVLSFDVNGAAAQVMRLYDTALNRLPDQGGLEATTRALSSGAQTLQQLANGFINSAEFQARYGALSNQAFVEQLYRFGLDRDGDPQGIQTWTAALNSGVSRGEVLIGFSESPEHRGLTAATLAAGLWISDTAALSVARLYDATFDRLPDTGGLSSWVTALKNGTSLLSIAEAFSGSAEFQARYGALTNQAFVEQLYRFCLNREGDAPGIQNWVAAINSGVSRASVLLQFSESTEHTALTAPSWSGGIQYAGYAAHAPAEPLFSLADDAFALSADLPGNPSSYPAEDARAGMFAADHDDLAGLVQADLVQKASQSLFTEHAHTLAHDFGPEGISPLTPPQTPDHWLS